MRKRRIRVMVEPGLFSTERSVVVDTGSRRYTLLVDQEDVQDDTLLVSLVAEGPKESLIDLPRETFTSGSRIRVPSRLLAPA